MTDPAAIGRDLKLLEAELRRLESEYTMYFANRVPRPPFETRRRVEMLMRRWDGVHISTTADRFRLTTLQARFVTFVDLWDRNLRAREEGRSGTLSRAESTQRRPAPPQTDGVVLTETLADADRERGKLDALYKALMDARRQMGEDEVPFGRFADMVRDQLTSLHARGNAAGSFRVGLKDGKVTFTVRPLKKDV